MTAHLRLLNGRSNWDWQQALPQPQVAAHLRLSEGSYDPDYLAGLVISAGTQIEEQTGCDLLMGQWEWGLECWPQERIIALPRYPVSFIGSVAYLSPLGYWVGLPDRRFGAFEDGWEPVSVTDRIPLDNNGYSTGSPHQSVRLPPLHLLPELHPGDAPYKVRIEFRVNGYQHRLDPVLRIAWLMKIADLYDGRKEPNPAVESLLLSRRQSGFAA